MTTEQRDRIANALAALSSEDRDALTGLLSAGAEGCDYAAEDYSYRADFDRKHHIEDDSDYDAAGAQHHNAAHELNELLAAIQARTGRTP